MKYWMILLVAGLAACGGTPPVEEATVTQQQELTEQPAPTTFAMTNDAPSDVAGAPEGVTQTPSGLAYKVLVPPTEGGKTAGPTATVTAHYVGWTTDGQRFDSSLERGEPATFPLDKVIKGWQEGVGSMGEGEIRRLWIPEDLAYQGREGFPLGLLVFDVQLIQVN